MLAVCYQHVGRLQEARAMLEKGFKGWPPATKNVRFYITVFFTQRDLQVTERFAEALVNAGLPGEPTGFYKISAENRLTGSEIRKLFFGRKVAGSNMRSGQQWWIERSEEGDAAIRDGDTSDTGKSWIEEDMLCDQWDNLYESLRDCWVIYRNPEETPDRNDEFLGAPGYGIYPFSLVE